MSDASRDALRAPGDPPPDAQARAPETPDATHAEAGSLLLDTLELGSAIARLAAAEAAFAASALAAKWRWRALALLACVPAWLLLSLAAIFALRDAFDSAAIACAIVGGLHALVALLAIGRARARARDAGLPRTADALRAIVRRESPP